MSWSWRMIATELCIRKIREQADEGGGSLPAVQQLTKVCEVRAKLLGLNAPEKREIVADLSPDGVAETVRGIFKLDDRKGAAEATGTEDNTSRTQDD